MDELTIIEKLEKDPTEMVEIIPKVNNKKTGLAILVTVIFLAVFLPVVVLTYLLITGNLNLRDDTEVIDDEFPIIEEENESKDVSWTDWEGEFLQAKLPEGWRVDENGEDYSYEYFSGLFSLGIFNDKGEQLISLDYSGIGGMMDCEQVSYIKFPDYNPDKLVAFGDSYSDVVEYSEGSLDMVCKDVQDRIFEISDFVDIKFLDNHLRRVNTGLYYVNVSDDPDFFESSTGVIQMVIVKSPVVYGGISYPTGGYLFTSRVSIDEAELLDQVLESIEIVENQDIVTMDGWAEYIHEDLGFLIKFPTDGASKLSFDNSVEFDAEEYVIEKSYVWENGITNLDEVRINYWKNSEDRGVEDLLETADLTKFTSYEMEVINGITVYRGYNNNLPQAYDSLSYLFKIESGEIVEVLYYINGDYDIETIERSISSLELQ